MLVQLGTELAELVFTAGPPFLERGSDLVLPDRDLLAQGNHGVSLGEFPDGLPALLVVLALEKAGSECSNNQ